jgi:Putative lumazine-binding
LLKIVKDASADVTFVFLSRLIVVNNFTTLITNIMKTLKAMMMGLALLVFCGVANAGVRVSHNPTKDEVVDTYVNAVTHGDLKGLDDAIDDDAQFNTKRGDNVNTLTKDQLLDALKADAGIRQDCKCTATVLQDMDDTFIKKVEMNYGDFTRTDVVTAQRTGYGWKITKVETSYK